MRAMRWIAVTIVVVLAAAVVLVVTRGADPTRPDRDGVLEITMEHYKFTPDRWYVTAGEQVVLRFVNDDEVTHHVSMGRGLVEADRRAVGFETDLLDQLDVAVEPSSARVDLAPPYEGFTVEVRGGTTVTVTTTFTESTVGEWHIGCFTGRGCHFRSGLDGILTIEPSR